VKYTAIAAALILAGCASAPPKEAPLTHAEAKAAETREFAAAMTSAKDAETQRLLVFAWALRGNAPQPQVVEHSSNLGTFALAVLDRAFGAVPSILAYRGQVKSAETTKSIAEINRDVSLGQFASTSQIAIAGINGSSAIGTALANRPSPTPVPTTQVTVTGNSGPVNFSGTQNSNSLNPVNPSPVVCLPGTSTTAGSCSR